LLLVSLSLGVISLLNVTVRSEASNGSATISVNDKNYAPQTKGYNVVVFDALSGSFVLNTRFYVLSIDYTSEHVHLSFRTFLLFYYRWHLSVNA